MTRNRLVALALGVSLLIPASAVPAASEACGPDEPAREACCCHPEGEPVRPGAGDCCEMSEAPVPAPEAAPAGRPSGPSRPDSPVLMAVAGDDPLRPACSVPSRGIPEPEAMESPPELHLRHCSLLI